jgi:hypothetical protein
MLGLGMSLEMWNKNKDPHRGRTGEGMGKLRGCVISFIVTKNRQRNNRKGDIL